MLKNRLGLCCLFQDQSIHFKTITAALAGRLKHTERLRIISDICRHNAESLAAALEYCATHQIGSFRVSSRILPLKTHPQFGYTMTDLPNGDIIVSQFRNCGRIRKRHGLRATFHPDQFIVPGSPDESVVANSIAELEYQTEVAGWIGADVINIHGGGAYGDKTAALRRLTMNLRRLPAAIRRRLTLENDDRIFTPVDLFPVCKAVKIPLVYDVHHHRCNPDGLSIEEATYEALRTWRREPLMHISSPRDGWKGAQPFRHHDFIQLRDYPLLWQGIKMTVEVEAKAKEVAIARLRRGLLRRWKGQQQNFRD